ncbi:deoxyribose-phosphate aldolase [Lentimicrobium sp. S6]|uniref:deoxyribose-phosphate aldolase n=1 Tax=Lentimicrobium sp. S6 TaxID=2735872 RepID=UPI001551BEAD|nr:deoxyribose-phosphate aldolase [Lentimicrobium sp. S6]NPD44738.1 deoxyribose-phosphate aldolase [Lentimicrobium sp. S6]
MFNTYSYTSEEIQERIQNILNKGKQDFDQQKAYRQILSFIDLTTLEGADTNEKAANLAKQACNYANAEMNIPNVAAVCVYPTLVKVVKENLTDKNIGVASVAGAFPAGMSPIEIKVAEVKYAVTEGADDIDMVLSRGKFLEGKLEEVQKEVKSIKEACGAAHLKVILETGELKSVENIRKASELSILGGGDFIKTSTGKIPVAATLEAMLVMLDTIKEYYEKTGKKIGIKPAGGISEPEVAIDYYVLVKEILGEDWLNNHLFRIGASRLANKVFDLIK